MSEPYPAAEGLVRVYPAREPNGTGLLWAHGGGFAFGDLDMPESDWVAAQLASRGTTVVSVDYRLAPVPEEWADAATPPRAGHHYPAASDDLLTAWSWVLENAARLRVDRRRLAIGGTSAGGNLAAGATLRLLERRAETLPALVLLAYPTLLAVQPAPDAALRAALDAQPDADRFGPDAVRGMYENYLGGPVDGAPLGAVPGLARREDLAQFPPTLMVNGDVDELRVSGEAFAASLRDAGRPVDVVTEPGTDHGHLNRPHEPAASVTIDRFASRLAALQTPTRIDPPAA
ncbi:alpha/beta hydrolase fold domain-containing protein [Microbacterium trichothecenolyticum]|uniref:Alpha/beta hydrolase fold domain-containing protein n=1 Tax=Microbacterium ureisolvens TaxID=2781186 RepID=A0ABS7HXZ0_9MICO|nr:MULTISPECIES: alpha/beta hydrolase fold domain-containing protein [Microbacterium]MBW9109123.1 alpha/beta hydrolase fold domain-containing protein [Microbacterium ureisolvens]MBW9119746.1 alpha/beta hydrolase fold domain-containing protein [Microbacterium trichothecenolyticum]